MAAFGSASAAQASALAKVDARLAAVDNAVPLDTYIQILDEKALIQQAIAFGGGGGPGTIVFGIFRAIANGSGYSTNDLIVLRQTEPAAPVYYNATTSAVIETPPPVSLGEVSIASNVISKSLSFRSTAVIQRANNITPYSFTASPRSGDQYGATITLPNFGTPNGFVLLNEISAKMNIVTPIPLGMSAAEFYIFSQTPNPARGDNDAFALPFGDSQNCLTPGGIPFTFRAATGGGSCEGVAINVNRLIPVPASGSVFVCIVVGAAFTPNVGNESGVLTAIAVEP